MAQYSETLTIEKACKVCHEVTPLDEFYAAPNTADGRMGACKECIKARSRVSSAKRPKKHYPKVTSEADITIAMVDRMLRLDTETYEFYWKVSRGGGRCQEGTKAGYVNDGGYVVISFCGRDVRAHRLVWFVTYGAFPEIGLVIDHIDRNKLNNHPSNLRVVSCKLNAHNIVAPKKQGTSGYLGVRKFRDRYTARIYSPAGKEIQIGTYDTPIWPILPMCKQKQTFIHRR